MGLLRELFFCRSAIEPNIVENAANIKRHIIQNNIYGVDIERGAVDIARLRFWLSLIVDEKSPEALPNLDFKIMQGNSLLEQYKGVDLSAMTETKVDSQYGVTIFECMLDVYRKNLRDKLAEYYACPEHDKKVQLRKDIADIVKQELIEQGIRIDFGDLDLSANSQFFLWHTWFHDVFSRPSKEGFDIVIGNPPYKILTRNNTNNELLSNYIRDYTSIKTANSKNLFTLFIELAVANLAFNKDGVVSFIIPEGLFKTRSYKDCVGVMEKYGSTLQTVSFSDYVFENAITGSLIFLHQNGVHGLPLSKFHYRGNGIYEKEIKLVGDSLLDKIENETVPLGQLANLFKGMVVKDRDVVLHKEKGNWPNSFILGKNISKWSIDSFLYTDFIQLEIIGGTKRLDKHNVCPRIVIRRTGAELCCALLTFPCLTESTLYSCWPKDSRISIYSLLGILNSSLMDYYNKHRNITNQQGFPQILMTDLQQLPIKIGSVEQMKSIEIAVEKILRNPSIMNNKKELDDSVYHLYGLSNEDIMIVEG